MSFPNFRSILAMTVEEAQEFCASNNLKFCIVYSEPHHITTYSDKSVQNRADIYLYVDATDTYRVRKADIYRDGMQIAVVRDEDSVKEKRVKELVDDLLKNEKLIVMKSLDKCIQQIYNKEVVTETDAPSPIQKYNCAEDMRQLWKSYGKV